ncbi:MAG: hypothetical protein II705_03730 [Clostridia bacterium]|nr:hypothetical protein [Clostridia bacterium]
MLLTVFLAVVFCGAATLMLISGVAFVLDTRLFSSAPKEAQKLLRPRNGELFYGARAMGRVMMIISIVMILGAGAAAIWDGFRCGFSFIQFFLRFVLIFTIYKAYDMIFFDWFLLCKFRFFQHYYPETAPALEGRRYGFNIKSQLLKLIVIFPAASALAAWVCSLF